MRCALLCLLLMVAVPVAAQQSGDEPSPVPTAQPPASAEQEPPPRGVVARLKAYVTKQRDAREEVNEPEGVYPRIGGLTTGSGLAVGAGYRRHLFNRAFYGDLSGVISTKWYLGLDARLRLPSPIPRLELWTSGAFRRYTQEDYFGKGTDSTLENRVNYGIRSLDVGGQAIVRVLPWLRVDADVGYFMPIIRRGTDPNWPSIEDVFTDATAPGVKEQPNFLHYGISATADYRDAPGNPRRGGLYRMTAAQWDDRSFGAYNFRRTDAEFAQYVPLGSLRHVLVGRTGFSFVNNAEGSRVPFYVLPYVGGASSVRSFMEFRFRDENALYVSGEYRYGLMKYVQLVGFLDAGKVAQNWEDINLHDMKPGYGGGVRAGTEARTFVRLDVGGGGGEGTRVFVKFFPTF